MPCSRIARVRARVSTPARPTTPRRVSQPSRSPSARQLAARRGRVAEDRARRPRCAPRRPPARCPRRWPRHCRYGKGEGDDLVHVGRVGEDLLIAGHGGVEARPRPAPRPPRRTRRRGAPCRRPARARRDPARERLRRLEAFFRRAGAGRGGARAGQCGRLSARRGLAVRPCSNCDPTANAATATCRRTAWRRGSAPSNAHSAPTARRRVRRRSAPTAAATGAPPAAARASLAKRPGLDAEGHGARPPAPDGSDRRRRSARGPMRLATRRRRYHRAVRFDDAFLDELKIPPRPLRRDRQDGEAAPAGA